MEYILDFVLFLGVLSASVWCWLLKGSIERLDAHAHGHRHTFESPPHEHGAVYAPLEHPHDYAEASHEHADRGLTHAHFLVRDGEPEMGPRGFLAAVYRCDVPDCTYEVVHEWPA